MAMPDAVTDMAADMTKRDFEMNKERNDFRIGE